MIITGSALFIKSESYEDVLKGLKGFPEVTFYAASDSRTELVITIEAQDHHDLERLCRQLQEHVAGIVEVAHMSVNFEEEIEKIQSGRFERESLCSSSNHEGSSDR